MNPIRKELLEKLARGQATYNVLATDIEYRDRQPYFAELHAMVKDGLVDRETGKDDEHPPYYTITNNGRDLL